MSAGLKGLSEQDWRATEQAYGAVDDLLARSGSRADCAAALRAMGDG